MFANAVDALNAGIDALGEVDGNAMPVRERLAAAEAMETAARRLRAVEGAALATLAGEATETLGGRPHTVIADRLRISPAAARRRLREAALVAQRATPTGQPVPPILENTATQWHAGVLDPEHVTVIAGTLADLPADTPFGKKQWAEHFLADKAAECRPDQLATLAQRLAATLNPDGFRCRPGPQTGRGDRPPAHRRDEFDHRAAHPGVAGQSGCGAGQLAE